jgi:p-cumate 2,3-dioxygenase subunit beta
MTITRGQVEDFLFFEADLLDNWRLDEWIALFDQERGGYYMPTTDHPGSDPNTDLFLIADDMPKLRSRVEQLLSGLTWAENPRSRTRHMISNVRILGRDGEVLSVSANFVVFRMRASRTSIRISAPIDTSSSRATAGPSRSWSAGLSSISRRCGRMAKSASSSEARR